jgi:predicted HTH transcriptional regulator
MLSEEGGTNDIDMEIDSLCDRPCPSCDSEVEYFKLNLPKHNFTKKCQNCENFKKLFIKLKEHEEQCYQLRQEINFASQHRLQQKFNQIKSVASKLKTDIAESLR